MEETDAQILAWSTIGDPGAFVEVTWRHGVAIHAYLCRRAGQDRADDLLGDVWLQAFRSRAGYDQSWPDVRPWLYGISRNVLRAHWRLAQVAAVRPAGEVPGPGQYLYNDSETSVATTVVEASPLDTGGASSPAKALRSYTYFQSDHRQAWLSPDHAGEIVEDRGTASLPGVGLGYVSAGLRSDLIFDPSTSVLLGEDETVVSSSPSITYPVETITSWTVYLSTSVVDSMPSTKSLPAGQLNTVAAGCGCEGQVSSAQQLADVPRWDIDAAADVEPSISVRIPTLADSSFGTNALAGTASLRIVW